MKKTFNILAVLSLFGWTVFQLDKLFSIHAPSWIMSQINHNPLANSAKPPRPGHYNIPIAPADAIGAIRISVPLQQPTGFLPSDSCLPTAILKRAELVVLGAYEGGKETNFEVMEDSEYTSVAAIDLVGAAEGSDLVLVVSANEPVVWNFEHFPHARLRAVLVFGRETQAVANLPPSTPVRFVTARNPVLTCGEADYAYEGGSELDELARNLENLTAKKISRFNGGYNPEILSTDANYLYGASFKPEAKWTLRASGPLLRRSLPPGSAGLNELMREGAIRLATEQDITAWMNKARSVDKSEDVHRVIASGGVYVVQKPIEIPAGFDNDNRVSYIVEAGVQRPRQASEGGRFYFMETGTVGY